MTYKAYLQNIEAKTGKSAKDFWQSANAKRFIKDRKIVTPHAQLLKWLKAEIGLAHVHASFVIAYLRLSTNDPKVSDKMKNWAYSTGYKDSEET